MLQYIVEKVYFGLMKVASKFKKDRLEFINLGEDRNK